MKIKFRIGEFALLWKAGVFFLVLASCSSSSFSIGEPCQFPLSGTPAPVWVCDRVTNPDGLEDYILAMGTAEKKDGNSELSTRAQRNLALFFAKKRLSLRVNVPPKQLMGVRVLQEKFDPLNHDLYILVGVKKGDYPNQAKGRIQ